MRVLAHHFCRYHRSCKRDGEFSLASSRCWRELNIDRSMARDSVSLKAWSRHENVECKFHTSRSRTSFRVQSSKARDTGNTGNRAITFAPPLHMGYDEKHWGNKWPGACERSHTRAITNHDQSPRSPDAHTCRDVIPLYPTLFHFTN